MDSFFGSAPSARGSSWSYDSLKNFRQISPVVQNHLKLVYLTLCCAIGASAVGAFLHAVLNIGGVLTCFGVIGCIIWLYSIPHYEERKRFVVLMAAALLEGATVGPLIKLVVDFDQNILVTTFMGTAVAFGCFSAAAMIARRREYLYLGGLLTSGLSILLGLQFASSFFGGSIALFNVEIYFGLLLFLGYVVFDTQQIIERAHSGDLDYISHSLTLFLDFVNILVRLLVIRMKNAQKEEEKKKKKKSS